MNNFDLDKIANEMVEDTLKVLESTAKLTRTYAQLRMPQYVSILLTLNMLNELKIKHEQHLTEENCNYLRKLAIDIFELSKEKIEIVEGRK